MKKTSMEKQFDEWTTRYCFICKKKMEHVGGLCWHCKNCDVIDNIEHTVLPYGRKEFKDKNKIEFIC